MYDVTMCGHIQFFEAERLYDRWQIPQGDLELQKNYNVYPGGESPVIQNDGVKSVSLKKFGFDVSWSKQPIFNAKVETVSEKPLFRKKIIENRCLIPVTKYFEWRMTKQGKVEYEHRIKGERIFALAGLCDQNGFAILTTEPWPGLAKIHRRMPVVLKRANEEQWLNPDLVEFDQLEEILEPMEEDKIEFKEFL